MYQHINSILHKHYLLLPLNSDTTQFLYSSSAVQVPLYKTALFPFLASIIPIPGMFPPTSGSYLPILPCLNHIFFWEREGGGHVVQVVLKLAE